MTTKTSRKRRKMISSSRSSKHMIQAAEVISNNVDLLTEILVRVPAKSLLRFCCVSKNWLSLISDTHFVRNHARVNHWPPVSGFYFDRRHYKQQKTISLQGHITFPTLAFLRSKEKTVYPRPRVVQSCNGLILCKEFRRPIDRFIVCNPTTQKYMVLPKAPVVGKAPLVIVRGGFLAFDPSKSPHYKVLVAEYYDGFFNIFSSESSSWKEVNIIQPPELRNRSDHFFGGIFWSGSIHWLSNEIFLRFDFEAEQLIWMPHPLRPKILPVDNIRYFGECCGHLILIQSRLPNAMGFRILEMERDYSGWTVKYRVNLGRLTSAFPQITCIKSDYKFHILSVIKGKTGKYFTLVLAVAGTVISYDLACKTWTVLDFPGRFPFDYSGYSEKTYKFVESLAPI